MHSIYTRQASSTNSALTLARALICRDSPFVKTNNSGGGFGKSQRCFVILHTIPLTALDIVVATVMQLGTWTCCLCAQPDMSLKTLQVCYAPLINMPRTHYFVTSKVLSHYNPRKLLNSPMQALVAGTVCKWQMELACRCHYGPSDQVQGNRYTTTPKRYHAYLHKHLQNGPIAIMVELTFTLLSNSHQEVHACSVFVLTQTASWWNSAKQHFHCLP